jgi:hypothetical protein
MRVIFLDIDRVLNWKRTPNARNLSYMGGICLAIEKSPGQIPEGLRCRFP